MSMKTNLFAIVICISMLVLSGCKDKGVQSVVGTTEKPAWSAPADYDMTSSMTAIIKVDLTEIYTPEQLSAANYQLSADDLVAAFSDNECLGVATLQDGLFYLFICAPSNGSEITLRYYSNALKNIFTTAPITFVSDGHLGSINAPYIPAFVPAE